MPRKANLRMAFTKPAIQALEAPTDGSRLYVHDARVPGLCLLVTAAGAKSFYIYKWMQNRPTRIRLGSFPDLSVEQARKAATALLGSIALGNDPQAEKRKRRAGVTLGEAWTHYKANRLDVHGSPKSVAEDVRRHKKYLARWASRRLKDLESDEVCALHVRIGRKGKVEANRVAKLLKRIINHARKQLSVNIPNPVDAVQFFKENARERFLSGEELGRLFRALADESDTRTRDVVLLAVLTGARKTNLCNMRWSDLDLDNAVWRIPAAQSKSKNALVVVLPGPAVALLRARQPSDGEYVFRDRFGRGPNLAKGWPVIRERAGLQNCTLHDLRRSYASVQLALGSGLSVIGKALGHRSLASTGVYARLDVSAVRDSVDRAAQYMATMMPAKLLTGGTTEGDGKGASNSQN